MKTKDLINEAGHFVRATLGGNKTKVILISGSKSEKEAHDRARSHYEKRGHAVIKTDTVRSSEAHKLMAGGKLRPSGINEELTHIIRSVVVDKHGTERQMLTPIQNASNEEQAHAIAKEKLEKSGHKVLKSSTVGSTPREKSYVPPPQGIDEPYGYGQGRYMGDSVEFSFGDLKKNLSENVRNTLMQLAEKKQSKSKDKDKDDKKKVTKKEKKDPKDPKQAAFPTVDLQPELGKDPGMANSVEGEDNAPPTM